MSKEIFKMKRKYEDIKKEEELDRKLKEGFKLIFSIIQYLISAAVLIGILFLIYVGIMKFKEYLNERADRKAICAERIESVENDVAAKKLFEACMDR